MILTARRTDKFEATKQELEADGFGKLTNQPIKVKTLVFDVRDAEAAKVAID